MAGIGIELRRLTNQNSFLNFIRAHIYAGILGSGSWVISISVLTGIYFYIDLYLGYTAFNVQFLVTVTYLVASSLIFSSFLQQPVARYIADRLFDNRVKLIAPALFTSSLILTLASAVVAIIAVQLLLPEQSLFFRAILVGSFVELNLIWLFSNTLAGLKEYKVILYSYLLSYVVIFELATTLYPFELVGLLLAYYIGITILLSGFIIYTVREYVSVRFIRKDILDFAKANRSLIFAGLLFQLGIWVDKFCFWINPETSNTVIGLLRSSPIYDMPMYLAFVLMIPGLGVFFYEIEANFSRYYARYYDAIREGATLSEINDKLAAMIGIARITFINTLMLQVFITLVFCLFTPEILNFIGLSSIYVFLFRINLVSACLLVILLGQLSYFYHLNKNKEISYICLFFFLSNLILTQITIIQGPWYYGYGFALSVLLTNMVSIVLLINIFKKLSYYAFMSQG